MSSTATSGHPQSKWSGKDRGVIWGWKWDKPCFLEYLDSSFLLSKKAPESFLSASTHLKDAIALWTAVVLKSWQCMLKREAHTGQHVTKGMG